MKESRLQTFSSSKQNLFLGLSSSILLPPSSFLSFKAYLLWMAEEEIEEDIARPAFLFIGELRNR